MKKLFALLLAAMLLLTSVSALAEAPEGYPEVKEGIDFGGATLYIDYYWTPDARKALGIPEGRTLESLQAELQAAAQQ